MSIKKDIFAPLALGLGATRRALQLLLVMMLTATTAWATTFSTINVGSTDYALFTGFTATDGSHDGYGNMVDGNTSTGYHVFASSAYVEFNADDPIVPRGYIFNTYVDGYFFPTSWELKAKASAGDSWTTISSESGGTSSGTEFTYSCSNDGNNKYKYFRFEVTRSGQGNNDNIWLTEIRLYGNMSYTHIAVKAATCTETGIKQECWRRTDGKYFTDETGTTELAESDVIAPMIPHDGQHHDATDTNIEYWQCSVCGKYFSDEACTTEITEAETHSTVFGALSGGCYTLTSKTYTLTEDVNTAGYIYVPEGVTATIDLAGYTIDRGLTSAVANGYVIKVAGTLTLTDSSTGGTVKGGMHDEYTSCVYVPNGGTFTLAGGTLIGNTSNEGNRAVYVAFSAHFIMTGGKITGDVCGIDASGHLTISGGEISGNSQRGIYPREYSISISGNPRITDNGNVNVNLYFDDAARLTVTGALTEGASIGITPHGTPTANAPVTVTNGYGTYNTAPPDTYFTLDDNSFVLGWNEDRTEVAVGTELYTVDFDMNGHGSAIDAVSLLSGYKVLEPTVPTADDWYFVGWYTDAACTAGNEWNFDDAVTSNMTLHALWTQEAIYSFTLPEKMVIVSTTNAPVGGKYPVGTVIKFKVSSADYVVDGDVSDGTNTLTPDGDGIYTVTMGDADITITATIKKAAEPNVTLSGSDNYTANDDDVLTGSTSGTLTIPDGAKVTLSDVTISGGIVCAGTAEITLVGENVVGVTTLTNALIYKTPGIKIGSSGTTLTIKGNGSLNATGGNASAGIGLGRTWDDNATGGRVIIEGGTVTASGGNGIGTGTVGNNMTATIGDIIIKGGTVNARLGKGEIVGVATANIGAIKIYDTIEKVDASKITESVTYMHDDTDVTASASTYFTITEDGDRRVIVPKDNTDYTITIADGIEHGTLTGAATAKYMEKVTITATPDFGYRLSSLVVKDAQNKSVATTGNSFFMPKSNVTVSAVFEQGTHGTTEFAWGYSEPDGFVTEATIYNGVTTVNIQNREMSYHIRKYEGNTYYKFLLDNNTDYANIPYAGGTGVFPKYGNATNFSVPYDGETGFYDITMTDVGNGKWNVSILKTAGQMDVVPAQTYTGSEIKPEPLVIAGSLNLTKGTDYVYSYTNNTNAGTAKVRATFQGDYASLGYVEKEFTIVIDPSDWADNGDGTYTIKTATGWSVFCDCLDDNDTYNRFSGKTVRLADDITVTRMAGSDHHDFCGTFDGQGHTLTVDISSDSRRYTAPFAYVSETTPTGGSEVSHPAIRNLNVTGTVNATKEYASGLVGAFWGTLTIENCTSSVTVNTSNKYAAGFISNAQGNAIIRNCLSSATINSTVSGDGTHAGFIGVAGSVNLNIEGCAFTGSLLGTSTTSCAGFVGYGGTVTITNSLYAPAEVTVQNDNSATFARGNTPSTTNCYYTAALGAAQGTAAYVYTPAAEGLVPQNVGAEGTDYSESGITAYASGLKYNGKFYLVKAAVSLVDNADNSGNIVNNQVADVTLSGRTLYKDGDWNTLCLPFDVSVVEGSPLDGAEVKTLTGSAFAGGKLALDFTQAGAVTTLEAGKPYIIRWASKESPAENLVNPVFNGVTVSTATANVETDCVDFIGILSPTVIYESGAEKTNLYMGSANKLYYPTVEGFRLNACRGYFKLKGVVVNGNGNDNGNENAVRSFDINFGDDATGIVEMRDEKGEMRNGYGYEDGGWYTVDGRRLDGKPAQKGLYIHGGRKVVIK